MFNPKEFLQRLTQLQNSFQPQASYEPPPSYNVPYSPTEQGPLPVWEQQGGYQVPTDPVMQMLKHPTGMNGNIDIEQLKAKLREYQANQPSY